MINDKLFIIYYLLFIIYYLLFIINRIERTMDNVRLKIIIIDDNPEIHKDFIKTLSREPVNNQLSSLEQELFGKKAEAPVTALPEFQIDTASQGQEGVELIAKALKEGAPYALAFVDIRMPPGWDGVETIKHIWELAPDMQVVICTAYSDYTWEETVNELSINDNLLILKKPFDSVAVRQLACALTKKWCLLQESRAHQESLERRIRERTSSLQHSLSLIQSTFESSAEGILVTGQSGSIVNFNNKIMEMWNIPSTILTEKDGNSLLQYITAQLRKPDAFAEQVRNFQAAKETVFMDTLKLKNGKVYEYYSQPHKLNEETVGRVWSFRDITQRFLLEEQMEHQATHDALTGLPNRVLLYDRIGQAIEMARRAHKLMAILFLDLDRFKLVNDSLSHEAGDTLLKVIAKRLSDTIRARDTLSRLGGDEFVIVLADLNTEEDITKIADKLLAAIKQPIHLANREISVTGSIGVALYPKDGATTDELLRNADLAMYQAKGAGANRFQGYTTDLSQKNSLRFEQENELQRAIANNEFFLCYQPQVDIKTGKMKAVEALIRWQHPTRGVVLPIDFIPIAEETGLITPIGEWVLRTACKQNKLWQDQGLPPFRMAVNVSTQQFMQSSTLEVTIEKILKETGLEAQYLEIELTENIIINNTNIVDTLTHLKKMGIHIALDDFGTGNTTINYLRILPLDHLKIDKTFIANIDSSEKDNVLLKAIIAMAKGLNLEILAEGVENSAQLDFLKDRDCNEVQGFYFSKPVSEQAIEDYLRNQAVMEGDKNSLPPPPPSAPLPATSKQVQKASPQ